MVPEADLVPVEAVVKEEAVLAVGDSVVAEVEVAGVAAKRAVTPIAGVPITADTPVSATGAGHSRRFRVPYS
jgi:hypothetical protein